MGYQNGGAYTLGRRTGTAGGAGPGPAVPSEKVMHVYVFTGPATFYDVPSNEVAFDTPGLIDVYLQGDYQDNVTVPQAQRITPSDPFQTGDVLAVVARYGYAGADRTWISIGEPAPGTLMGDPALIALETDETGLYDLVLRTS